MWKYEFCESAKETKERENKENEKNLILEYIPTNWYKQAKAAAYKALVQL